MPPAKAKKSRDHSFEIEKHLREFCEVSSEELGNALGTVLGELDYALSSHQPQVRERSMIVAVSAVERAIALARNLRYFSLHTKLDVQMSDLTATVLDTVDLLERELEFQKITIAVRAEAGLMMNFDAAAIQQVILNLLINAAQAMPTGGKITISLHHLKDTVEIGVHDSGDGMTATEMHNLFVPYRTTKSKAAKGLGLTVARALVESHGGEIRVDSKKGKGTAVMVALPYLGAKKGKVPREVRRYRRARVHIPATVMLAGDIRVNTQLSILSLGGCYVRLSPDNRVKLPKVNDFIGIRIQYFGEEEIAISRARVKNLVWAGDQSGVGLEFDELTSRARKLIDAIVRSHSL
ncbi:MAG: PilZ domain-containing protein [Deltaproteobacteria bacterium]|nr:PilZ domain-containing protein [Deltaproteobacteria bacterium]MBI3293271.1 PilZ domain-containing protein [Deltaproteobacteria bacterium]